MKGRQVLQVVVPQSAAVLEPLGRAGQHLLVRPNPGLHLDLEFGQARGSVPVRCVCGCVCGWVGQFLEASVQVQVQVRMVMSVNWPSS